jgi:hypothetical protein
MWYTVLLLANVCRVKSSSFLTVSDFGHCTAHEIMPDGCMIGRRPWQRLPPLGMIAIERTCWGCMSGRLVSGVRASLSLCRRRTVSERGEDLSIEWVWGQSCDGRVCLFAPCLCVLSGSSLRVGLATDRITTVEKWLFLLVCLLVLAVTCLVCHGLS